MLIQDFIGIVLQINVQHVHILVKHVMLLIIVLYVLMMQQIEQLQTVIVSLDFIIQVQHVKNANFPV
jgi:hypothetical protein